jgi:hypothetical protein
VCVLGFEAEKIYSLLKYENIRFVHNEFFFETGSYKSLIMGYRACSHKNILVIHGDIIFNKKSLPKEESSIVIGEANDDVGILHQSGKILTFSYGFDNSWSKIIYLSANHSKYLTNLTLTEQDDKKFDFELYNQILDKDNKFSLHIGTTKEINTIKDYKKL